MSDPIKDLENFNSEGLSVNPLAPSEVRRLGDRMRRRRNAAAVVAGVAAVAVIAAPIALYAGRDDSSAPSPAPSPSESTTGSPDVELTTTPSPGPISVFFKEIPDGFPLAADWPDDSQAESDEMGLKGPNRALDSLGFTMCGATFDDPDYVDRLRAEWTNVEDYRDRQLTTYGDADEAVAAVKALTDFHRDCPTEDAGEGYTRMTEVQRTEVAGESWALVTHYEFGGAPAVGLTITHVIRLGRAVLIDTSSNEGGAGQDPEGEVQDHLAGMTAATAQPVSRMCVFTKAGCADGTDPIEPPLLGTMGWEGYGAIKLGMTLEEALATGDAVVSRPPGTEWCPGIRFGLASAPNLDDAVISERLGVAGIFFAGAIRTPEGIGLGSTKDVLRATYPEAVEAPEDAFAIPIPDHPDRQYYAMFGPSGRMAEMTLEFVDQDCYR